MHYFNARHMSAALERFMQPDPNNAGADILNPQSWNGYAYVLGNPLGLVDPSGMYAEANTTDNDDDGFYQCCNFFFFPVNIVSRGGGGGQPAGPLKKPAPAAKNGGTSTCTVSVGRTTAPGPGQATGKGAFGFVPPNGSVGIDPWALGLSAGAQTNAMLTPCAYQVKFSFSPAPNLPKGFPTNLTLGDVVGPTSARVGGKDFRGLDFDIYRLPALSAAYAATSAPDAPVSVTVTFPSSLPINCGGPLADTPPTGPTPYPSGPVAAVRSGRGQ